MSLPSSSPKVFLSYVPADSAHAEEMRNCLRGIGTEELVVAPEAQTEEARLASIAAADVVFVLLGPKTRFSERVNQEIDLGMQMPPNSPPTKLVAGLVAVILPEHPDHPLPYYDPENVPLRIHDYVSRESALLRKWPPQALPLTTVVPGWIKDAILRRQRFPAPCVNFSTLSALSCFPWDAAVDAPETASETTLADAS